MIKNFLFEYSVNDNFESIIEKQPKNIFYFVWIFNKTNILGFSFEKKYGFQLPEIFGYS